MLQITAHMKILVAVDVVDFRKGIDGLVAFCKKGLDQDAFGGTMFVFRNRRGTAIKVLVYDGQGFWLCQKRLSVGRFGFWPQSSDRVKSLDAHELAVLLAAGNPAKTQAAPPWRPLRS
jgi:transposase